MRKLITIVICLFALALCVKAQGDGKIIMEGVFKGKDLYIKNPFAAEGVGFCVYEIKVNGLITTDEVNSSAFAVDLQQYGFKKGEKVYIEIKHKADCKPDVLNPEAVLPECTFETLSIALSPSGILEWRTINEQGSLVYRIEQKKWNKWVKVGEVVGIGSSGEHKYNFQAQLHKGENTFRISQHSGVQVKHSPETKVISNKVSDVVLEYAKVFDAIDFSEPTAYELYNGFGELVAKGFGIQVDVTHLTRGKYYLNFEIFGAVEIIKR
jgi:hypothetical protein